MNPEVGKLGHQSQVKWLKDHDSIDILEFVTAAARYRGIQVGVQYAEGFIRVEQWPGGPRSDHRPERSSRP